MGSLNNLKILIAEDEPFTRAVLGRTLKSEGAWVAACVDGAEALSLAKSVLRVDIVLLDFMMPRVHGLYVLKQIRTGKSGLRHDIPVGLLTGASDRRILTRSVMLDCDAFIVKPVNKAELVERIDRLRRRISRSLREPAFYENVDVGTPDDINSIPDDPKPDLQKPSAEMGVVTEIVALAAGSVLAEDLQTVNGEVVVTAGTTITDGLRSLLHDLNQIRPLRPVAIRQ